MDIRNCRTCGKLFNYVQGPPICVNCQRKLDEKFKEVKSYIYKNPGAGIQEVSDVNEVSTSQIKTWIREERLSFAEDSMIGIDCERCGATIRTGRFCASCKDKVVNNLEKVYKKEEKDEEKMVKENKGHSKLLDNSKAYFLEK